MLDKLNNYDWDEVFKYATPTICEAKHVHKPEATITSSVSTAGFTREDVELIIAMEDGSNEGPNWLGLFHLKDGRFAFISAGCDYTGWG